MNSHLLLISAPVALGLLTRRLLRHPRGGLREMTRCVRDLISLRMVLNGTDPRQRAVLVRAHRVWRMEAASSFVTTHADSDGRSPVTEARH